MEEVIRSCVPFSGKLRGVILVILIHAVSSHKLIYSTPTTLQDQSTASRRPHSSTQGMVPYSTSSSNYERENSVTTLNRVISRPVEAGDLSLVTSALMELLSRTLVHEVNCIAQQPEVGRRVLTKLSEHFIPASLYVAADHIPRFPKQYKMSWIEAIKRHEDPYYISMELVVLGDLNFVADVISKRVKWIWNADLEGSSTSAACERLQKELYFGTQGLLLLVYPYGEERGGSSLVSVFRVSSSSDQGARFEMAARLQNSPVSNSDVKLQLKIFKSFWSSVPRDLEGAEVSMAYINKLGCFTVGSDRKKLTLDSATGYCAEVAKAASEYMNFSAVLKPTNAFGSPLDNGSWDGMVGMLVNRKAELAPLDFTPSLSRRSVVEMSQTLGTEELVMVTQSPGLVRQPFLLLHIFSLKVVSLWC
ncbi:Ionotropic glutamate receptor L-glutamate and glycine-binding domain [Trinorchestia longiramus]|nr:Ionotropic glutamate receptor L-glutamate and glycine-binding domain [Trinorchestia longiramus]